MSERPSATDEPGDFFSRWSRRKALVRSGQTLPSDPPVSSPAPEQIAQAAAEVATSPEAAVSVEPSTDDARLAHLAPVSSQESTTAAVPVPEDKPVLTLADVEKLSAESDFSIFAARDVDPAVRNAAMKKLFHAEPQFNVMDGLDVYIDDYNTPDPLPKAIMRTMLQARALGLLDDELTEQEKPGPEPEHIPADPPEVLTPIAHEDPDLQLQPHDAPGHEGLGEGADASPDDPDGPSGDQRDASGDAGPALT